MPSIFDSFPGVQRMLEEDRAKRNAEGAIATAAGKPWKVLDRNLGQWEVVSSHATEQEARDALAAIYRTCAPFVRGTLRIQLES